MPEAIAEAGPMWLPLVLLVGALATYVWRGLGVLLSGRIDPEGAVFEWFACVAYALLAGLIARMIVLPIGIVAETALADRLLATTAALAAFFLLTQRNMLLSVAAGAAGLILLSWLRGAPL